jgi:hypothetical protein
MSGNIASAFDAICKEAKEPQGIFLSLYASVSFYNFGGPEEGGWWGRDTVLEASQQYAFEEDAVNAKADIEKLAKKLSETARQDWGRNCLEEIEWCENRNLDHEDFLRETDGPTKYFVVLETRRGSFENQDSRHWDDE